MSVWLGRHKLEAGASAKMGMRERRTVVFDLRPEPWLPVLGADGAPVRVGILTALVQSHEILGFACEAPTLVPAVLRHVLVPLVIDALQLTDRAAWVAMFRRGKFSDEQVASITGYLERYGDRFDLFHPIVPFGQVAGLRTDSDTTRPVSVLVPHEPAGSVVPVFSDRCDALPLSLSPADAVLWLLHVQCWDSGAIKTGAAGDPLASKGKTMGNPVGPLGQIGVVVPTGRTLFETILLNTPVGAERPSGDMPPWRREPDTAEWSKRPAVGVVDLLTWQARRVRLFPDRTEAGVMVSRAVLAGGDRLETVPEWEPHTAWRRKSTNGRDPWYPSRHRPGRRGWQGLDALLASTRSNEAAGGGDKEALHRSSVLLERLREPEVAAALGTSYPLTVQLCALHYNSKLSGIVDASADSVPVSVAALLGGSARDAVVGIADMTSSVGRVLRLAQSDLRSAVGLDPLPVGSDKLLDAEFYFAIDPAVRRALRDLRAANGDSNEVENCLTGWELIAFDTATRVARNLFESATPSMFGFRTNGAFTYSYGKARRLFAKRLRETLARAAAAEPTTRKD